MKVKGAACCCYGKEPLCVWKPNPTTFFGPSTVVCTHLDHRLLPEPVPRRGDTWHDEDGRQEVQQAGLELERHEPAGEPDADIRAVDTPVGGGGGAIKVDDTHSSERDPPTSVLSHACCAHRCEDSRACR